MKKKKHPTKIFLILGILTFCSIPIILNFTIGQKITINQKVDLNKQSIQYLASVINMIKITGKEANTIKSDIQTEINKKMIKLNLKENIDYEIINLDKIKADTNLNDIIYNYNIKVNSIKSSKKATGKFTINLEVQENIDNRSIETIIINSDEKEGLSEDRANSICAYIIISIEAILNQGQKNKKDLDYKIINLELIKKGAKFDNYYNQIKVKGISNHLKGAFPINFKIEQE